MGVLDRFEKGIERAVNGAFARAFRSEVQPVEIASALRRECDEKAAIVGRDRTVVPNTFVVQLGQADHQRLGQWSDALGDELSAVLNDHARQQRYAFVGPVTVAFEQADDLDTGVFRVRSTTTRRESRADAAPYARGAYPPAAPPSYAPADPPAAPAAGGMGAGRTGSPGRPASGPPRAAQAEAQGQPPVLDVDGRQVPLTKSVTVIGRGVDSDIVLDDPGVSRRHAEIHLVDDRVRIIDLGSTNGTYVDGEKQQVGTLREGSTVTIGRIRMVFRGASGPPGRDDQGPW